MARRDQVAGWPGGDMFLRCLASPERSLLGGGLLPGAFDGVLHVGGVLRVPGSEYLEVQVVCESLEQALLGTQHERRRGDRELVDQRAARSMFGIPETWDGIGRTAGTGWA